MFGRKKKITSQNEVPTIVDQTLPAVLPPIGDWWKAVGAWRWKTTEERGDLRYGQWYFNCLYSINPQLAGRIAGTQVDPYHDDSRIPEFNKFVEEHWNDN